MALPTGLLNLSVIQPVSRQNLVQNPSIELNTNFWGAPSSNFLNAGTTITRGTGLGAVSRAGAWCLQNVTTGASGNQGVEYISTAIGFTNNVQYAFSFWINTQGATNVQAFLGNQTTGHAFGVTAIPAVSGWQKISVVTTVTENVPAANAGGTTGAVLVIRKSNASSMTFFVDGVQIETDNVVGGSTLQASTYIDGDCPGCFWLGAAHNSMSVRSGQAADGGIIVKIAPTTVQPPSVFPYIDAIENFAGIGAEPINNVSLPRGLLGGATYQRTLKAVRHLTFLTKFSATTLSSLFTKRDNVLGLVKYDLLAQQQTTMLRLDHDGDAFNIRGKYLSGLEGAQLSGFAMPAPLTFEAYDPNFFQDYDSAARLATGLASTSTGFQGIVSKPNNAAWTSVSAACNGVVNAILIDGNQNVYVAGAFTNIGGVATQGVAVWNPNTQAWSALGSGLTGGNGVALAQDAAGAIYVAGTFTGAGGAGNTQQLAKWTPSTSTWSSIHPAGPPTGGTTINALAFDNVGNLFAGGDFTAINAVAAARIAYMTPAGTWTAMGTGCNAAVRAITNLPGTNIMYIGGDFTTAGGVANASYITYWNGSFVALSAGTVGNVYAIEIAPNGDVYIGGTFATQASVAACKHVARWNGAGWFGVGNGVDGTIVKALLFLPNGLLYVGGDFTTIGTLAAVQLAIWNGSTYIYNDVQLPNAPTINALAYNTNQGILYVGHTDVTAGAARGVGTTTVYNPGGLAAATTSPGSIATAYPKVYFAGPGLLHEIVNLTTGDAIYFNNYSMLTNELLVLDLTPGNQSFISNINGDQYGQILPGSNISTFRLLPGQNLIGVLVGPGQQIAVTDCWCVWQNQYHSADGLL